MCEVCDKYNAIEEGIFNRGGGKKGLLTIAVGLVRRGLKLDPVPIKTQDTVVKPEFKQSLVQSIKDLQDGKIESTEFIEQSRKALELATARSYTMGVKSIKPDAEISDYDYERIQSHITKQMEFLSNFADDIERDEGTMDYEDRADMYVEGMDTPYQHGVISRTDENIVYHWVMGPSEHCDDCVEMADNSPYTEEELNGRFPGSGDTVCLTNCNCTLEMSTAFKDVVRKGLDWLTGE